MKKGMTLAEVLIVLVIMGVLASVSISVISTGARDHDRTLYKSAFKTVESVVSGLVSDIALYPAGNFQNANATLFCTNFSNQLNTVAAANCAATSPTPNFITSNGMRWFGFSSNFETGNATTTINVDIDGSSKGRNSSGTDILNIVISDQGRITPGATGDEVTYLTN